ncbi:MAG: hypothetical protein MUC88_22120 [Planctomycetes bacterium]|nr:hypothetical protein [Planctomycetota bacterium]
MVREKRLVTVLSLGLALTLLLLAGVGCSPTLSLRRMFGSRRVPVPEATAASASRDGGGPAVTGGAQPGTGTLPADKTAVREPASPAAVTPTANAPEPVSPPPETAAAAQPKPETGESMPTPPKPEIVEEPAPAETAESLPPDPAMQTPEATGPACSFWGHAPPKAAYRRVVNEVRQQYRWDREQAGRQTDPQTPRTAAEARMRQTKALQAARYTYRHAQCFQKLPRDETPRFTVKEIQIDGNTQLSAAELLYGLPAVYVEAPSARAGAEDPNRMYDFRAVVALVAAPGVEGKVSQRTIQGLTKYILAQYQKAGCAGVYVYVSAAAVEEVEEEARFVDGILRLRVIEAKVARVTTAWRDFQGVEKTRHGLKDGFVEARSPVQAGQVLQKKELDAYVGLLNASPDRHVKAVVAPGREPNELELTYDVYERSPWHFYAQLDNSGTDQRQWNPRLGFLNTNLTGRDDRLSAMGQADVESPGDNYAAFGLYDFPVTPRLRLGVYGGISEFDITPEATGGVVNFLGEGWFTGLIGRYTLLQWNEWFFDLTGSLSRETSEIDRSLGMDSDVQMTLAGFGFELHRLRETSGTSFLVERLQNCSGDQAEFENARMDTEPDFVKWSLGASHWQFLDPNRVHQVSTRFRGILPDQRLVPAKMTTFGGLYTVRGYPEDLIVADGGILASLEYRFNLSRFFGIDAQAQRRTEVSLAGFTDYARPRIEDPVVGEFDTQKMWSVGLGTILEVKPNLLAALYYGWVLEEVKSPSDGSVLTDEGDGRWNVNLIYRW